MLSRLGEWSAPVAGASSLLVPIEEKISAHDNLEFGFIVRNASDKPLSLKFHNLPLDNHTHWKFDVTDEHGVKVTPKNHPDLNEALLKEFVATQSHSYEVVLKPHASQMYWIPRLNSAERGWGYKDELEFQYFPMPPGHYTIKATALNLLPDVSLESRPITVTVAK